MLLAILLGSIAAPASAVAGPLEGVAQATAGLTGPAVQALEDRAGAAAPAVQQTVDATRAAKPVRSTVGAVTGAEPIRSALETVTSDGTRRSVTERVTATEPIQSAVEAVRAPVAAVTPGLDSAGPGSAGQAHGEARPTTSSVPAGARAGNGPRDTGRIGGATTRAGGMTPSAGEGGASHAFTIGIGFAATLLTAATELPRAGASSIAMSGDDGGEGGQPLLGHGGDSDLLGPGGLALLALGLLVALLTLVPRFSSRLLHTSATRWGPATFHVPIERPG